jgi:hypothetical protein
MVDTKKKRQTMRLSDEERDLIRGQFSEDSILMALRKVFYQMPLSAVDLSLLSLIKGKEMFKLIRKMFLPTIDADVPILQQVDFYMTVGLKEMLPEVGAIHIQAIKRLVDYIDQQLKVLETGKFQDKQKIQFTEFEDLEKLPNDIYKDMLARNTIINQVEGQLNQLYVFSNAVKDETPEETVKRLTTNSNK